MEVYAGTIRFSLKSNRWGRSRCPATGPWADRKQRESNLPRESRRVRTRDIALCSISLSQSVTGTVQTGTKMTTSLGVILTFSAGIWHGRWKQRSSMENKNGTTSLETFTFFPTSSARSHSSMFALDRVISSIVFLLKERRRLLIQYRWHLFDEF